MRGEVTDLAFFVAGRAIPQGSKSLMTAKSGRAYMRDASSTELRPWRSSITKTAMAHIQKTGWMPPQHVHVDLLFRFNRPAAAANRPYPNVKPDIDKLVRAVFDALTKAGAVIDDATIVSHYAAKEYADPGQPIGVAIVLTDATRQEALL